MKQWHTLHVLSFLHYIYPADSIDFQSRNLGVDVFLFDKLKWTSLNTFGLIVCNVDLLYIKALDLSYAIFRQHYSSDNKHT